MIPVGFVLPPDEETLDVLGAFIEHEPQIFEVAPETLWRQREGHLEANDYHALFLELGRRTNRRFIAHGVGYSMGGNNGGIEATRRARWRTALTRDQASFQFLWFIRNVLQNKSRRLLLDLANVFAMASNLDFDAEALALPRCTQLGAVVLERIPFFGVPRRNAFVGLLTTGRG